MRRDRDSLVDLAAETGFTVDALEKVIHLGELIEDVTRHPFLSTALHLKGGTALNLCFGPPARLSVGLDFNYVGAADRAGMLADRPQVETALERIARARGYQVQRSRAEHAGRKLYLGYLGSSGTPDRVEVDLNHVHRVALVPSNRRTLWQPGGFPRPDTEVVGLEELFIGKLCALLSRSLPRDLHDEARLPGLAQGTWGAPRFRSLFIAMAGTLDHPLHSYGKERFERATPGAIASQLHPMLSREDKPTADQLKDQAWLVVEPLLALSEPEREYTDRIQLGDLIPELLFPDDGDLVERLRRHPALLWKAENARRHTASGGRSGRRK